MYLPALAFPWLSLAPAAISGLGGSLANDLNKQSTLRFLWLWLLLPFLFFSASSGKLATYILPCFPPFAILMSVGMTNYIDSGRGRLFDFGMMFNALVFLGMLIVLLISQAMDVGFRAYAQGEYSRFAVLAFTLLAAASTSLFAYFAKRPNAKLAASFILILPLLFAASYIIPNQAMERKAPGHLLQQYRDKISANALVISESSLVRAAAWYLKRDDIYLVSRGEVEYGLGYPEARQRLLDVDSFQSLIEQNAPTRSILLVCHRDCDKGFTELLPPTAREQRWGNFGVWFSQVAGDSASAAKAAQ